MRRLTKATFIAICLLLAASLASAASLVGVWSGGDASEQWVVRFNADGTFTRQVNMGQRGTHNESGRYQAQGNNLMVQVQGQEAYTIQYQMQGDNVLVLYEDGQVLAQLQRSGGQPPQQVTPPAAGGQSQIRGQRAQMVQQLGLPQTFILYPYKDKTEGAFTVLVPKGWQTGGGVWRLSPQQTGGPFNAMKAKFNFWVYSPDKKVVMNLYPTWYYMDPRHNQILANQIGRSYQGATVQYAMTPQQFALKMAFPELHKKNPVSNVQVVSQQDLPQLTQVMRKFNPGAVRLGVQYSSGQVKVTYVENGVQYLEIFTVVIEQTGKLVNGLWSNAFTQVVRCPAAEVQKWGPIMAAVQNSFQIDMKWLSGELQGQQTRANTASRTWSQIQQIGSEITQSRQQTTALINYHQGLNLKGQQLYTNPYTGQPEVGPIWYERRLQHPSGAVIYTNSHDLDLGSEWKASEPRSVTAD